MERLQLPPRANWQLRANEIGFIYHSLGHQPSGDADGLFWFEAAAYRFTSAEVDRLEAATQELHSLCIRAVGAIVDDGPAAMARFGISPTYAQLIMRSWRRAEPHIMGRFDLAYDPAQGSIKMLEYNADTPTLLIESSLMQWFWLRDVVPHADQFNSLHERLIERFRLVADRLPGGRHLHITGLEDVAEERQHTRYFEDLAQQAGIETSFIDVRSIRLHRASGQFLDQRGEPISALHKLYPWEWLAREPFGKTLATSDLLVIEPPWKMLLSNKAILPVLWEMNPGHPLLLAAGWQRSAVGPSFVTKPTMGREGANMTLTKPGTFLATGGSYAGDPLIFQELASVPRFDGQNVIIGSWVVGDEPAGMIIRESDQPIIVNTSRVVPHFFEPAPG